MTQQTVIAPVPAQQSTCATCTKFKDYHDRGRGECTLFDKVTRKHHTLTQDCRTAIEQEQLDELLSTHNARLAPITPNFPGRDVYKKDPGYNSSSKVGYVSKNYEGWFARNRYSLTVADRQPSQIAALTILLDR